jgi:hypothetical protein
MGKSTSEVVTELAPLGASEEMLRGLIRRRQIRKPSLFAGVYLWTPADVAEARSALEARRGKPTALPA